MNCRVIVSILVLATLSACGKEPLPEGSELVDVFSLKVGDCLNDDTTGTVSETIKVGCDMPHLSEVYHLFNLPSGPMPDDEAMSDAADEGCLDAFEAYVGIDYPSSVYVYQTLTPTRSSWRNGDREIVCLLAAHDDSLIAGSLRNAKR